MKRLPIGVENFKTMIDKDFYYVDKTSFIQDVLNEEVILYTRPRRFHRNSVDTFGIR
ncbi:AAA family ATPase, partial [[Clostridium] innocuum]|uniref:AAA family ATPase n=1 Tax=Clostridium innocuum TaxID=1522 RepID=UPI0022B88EFD